MNIAYLLYEALKDISTDNKLYHRTNIDSFVDIVKDGGLKGYYYGDRMAKENNDREEIATGRKATFTTVDKTKKYADLSGNVGNIELILFKDRIQASVRGNKITPIAEYNIMNKKNIEKELKVLTVSQHQMNIEKMANLLIANRKKLLEEKSGKEIQNIIKFMDEHFPNARKKSLSFNKWELLHGALFRYDTQEKNSREGEERINLPKGNKIPLNPLLVQVKILPSFKFDFKEYASEFIDKSRLEALLQAVKNPIVLKDPTQSRMINYIMKAIQILETQGENKLLDYYGLDKREKKYIVFTKQAQTT